MGEEPVWVCDANLMGATCSCAACPEDNTRGEVCDGRDNDCDGVVDNAGSPTLFDECEDVDGAFVAGCMNGACIYACEGGRVDINGDLAVGSTGNGCECALSNGGVEICDGLDNDCDGLIDDFDTPPSGCEPVEGAFVTLCDAGACTYACEEGRGDADGD
ncbi:MAG: MopE-related protein, partial [Myxococcota bacterium]